jgi:peptide deformylase
MTPLKIVPASDIPKPADLKNISQENLMKVFSVCLQMQILCEKENGIGLSAVQVGIPWRLFVVRGFERAEYRNFLDCEYEACDGAISLPSIEGCLSIRTENGGSRLFRINRFNCITVRGQELETSEEKPVLKQVCLQPLDPIFSVVFQHEIDHHRGILISDIGQPIEVW